MSKFSDDLDFITKIMNIEKYSSKKFGFITIQRVDENTFTIKDIDKDELVNNLGGVLTDEISINSDRE